MRKRALVALAVVAASATLALAGIASGDDRSEAVAVLTDVGRDTAHAVVVAGPVEKAKTALERGTRMRAAGDEGHARLAEGLALDWAMVAKDLLAAATVEERAKAARVDVLDAGARVERERALLEEEIARTGRLRAELEAQQKSAPEAPRTSSLASRPTRADAGAALSHETRDPHNPLLPVAPLPARPRRKAAADGGAP